MWKKSIDCDPNYLTQAETCEKIATLYYKRGDLKNYALYMSKMSEAKDSLYTRKKKYNMSELQSNINSSLSMKDLLDTITSASMGILIIILLCIVVFSLMLHRTRKRLIAVHNRLKAEKQSLEQAKAQIKSLKKESAKKSDRIEKLNNDIMVASQSSEANARCGKELYLHINNGGTTVTWTKQDYELCMAYCKIEFAETMAEIERCYGNIAPRKQLIMLLQHLNYDYAAIGKVLGINSDSVRKNIARITPLTK